MGVDVFFVLSGFLIGYTLLKEKYPSVSFEDRLNTLGYIFLNGGKLDEAIQIFNLNVKVLGAPKSAALCRYSLFRILSIIYS